MAYYSYYQNSNPAWGTQLYQPVTPPIPKYQPQPSWNGVDYYRAHADTVDKSLFEYVWSKVRRLISGQGVGRHEAAHWWTRIYGGLGNPSKLLPRDIGAAAGYEAVRLWEHHNSIYVKPLSANREREREALIGLATAEATKLWVYTRRPRDKYGRAEASEIAAATAARIFAQNYDHNSPYKAYGGSPRIRRRSLSGSRYDRNPFLYGEDSDDDDDTLSDFSDYVGTAFRGKYDSYSSRNRGARPSTPNYISSSPVDGAFGLSPAVYPQYTGSSGVGYTGGVGYIPYGYGGGAMYPAAVYQGSSPYITSSAEGAGIPGTYYPQTSPYVNHSYVGASVGLPPPPGQFLGVNPPIHRRSRSIGSYEAVGTRFQY